MYPWHLSPASTATTAASIKDQSVVGQTNINNYFINPSTNNHTINSDILANLIYPWDHSIITCTAPHLFTKISLYLRVGVKVGGIFGVGIRLEI